MKNSEQAAFPLLYDGPNANQFCHDGLTKREYFAAMAIQGICANLEYIQKTYEKTPEHELIVRKSIRIADELLKQLEIQP